MLKSFRVIGLSAAFLLLGWTGRVGARQEKQKEKSEPARQQQQAKPEKQQQQVKAPKQEQQAKPEKQQQVKAPQQQEQQQQTGKPVKQEQRQATSQKQPQQQAASSQRSQRTQQAMATQRAQPALRLSSRGKSRIPDDRFQASFKRGHEFHLGNPVMVGGYSRFQYGGFWFGFVQPWPAGGYYTDNIYMDYVDGGYYMYDPYYPGARFAISVVLYHPIVNLDRMQIRPGGEMLDKEFGLPPGTDP